MAISPGNQPSNETINDFLTAAWQNEVDLIKNLAAEYPVFVDPLQPYLTAALSTACNSGQAEAARLLVEEYHADVNARRNDGMTMLHEALNSADMITAKMLIQHGADINAQDPQGATPLHYAVFHGSEEMVRFLLQTGVNKTLKDEEGQTPSEYARDKGRTQIADLIEAFPAHARPKKRQPKP